MNILVSYPSTVPSTQAEITECEINQIVVPCLFRLPQEHADDEVGNARSMVRLDDQHSRSTGILVTDDPNASIDEMVDAGEKGFLSDIKYAESTFNYRGCAQQQVAKMVEIAAEFEAGSQIMYRDRLPVLRVEADPELADRSKL